MALKYLRVLVHLNETHKQAIEIPEWELPILQAVHSPEHCTVQDEFLIEREPPDAVTEFERLSKRYKQLPKTEQFYTTAVYGMHAAGHNRLAELIRAAYVPDEPLELPEAARVGDPDQQTAPPVPARPRAQAGRVVSPAAQRRKPARRAEKKKAKRKAG